jgi:hypothetical protein
VAKHKLGSLISKISAIQQIDYVLNRHAEIDKGWGAAIWPWYTKGEQMELFGLYESAFNRLCPPGSHYLKLKQDADKCWSTKRLACYRGCLQALKVDYDGGYLKAFQELFRAKILSDFLHMAEYLLQEEKLKDPAAVLAGGVLEEHLRKLCVKHKIALPPKPKLDVMNAELAKANVYNKTMQKHVTAWAAIRNDAAHVNCGGYVAEQVEQMIEGIRRLILMHPA